MSGVKYYCQALAVMLLTVSMTFLGGCNVDPNANADKKDSTSSSSTNTTLNTGVTDTIVAGGLAMSYTDGDGIPNVKASPLLTPNSVTSTGTIDISVPVDSDVTEILFRPKSLSLHTSDDDQATVGRNTVWGSIVNGIATASLELFPTTAAGLYGVEMDLQYRPQYGNIAGMNYRVGETKKYQTISGASGSVDTNVAYPTYQVTATSTMGTSSGDPIPVSVNAQKKALVKPLGHTYLKVANSTQGKLYAIHMSTAPPEINLATSIGSMAGSGTPNATLVENDNGAGVPLHFSSSAATNYNVVSFVVREAVAGTAAAPVPLASKAPAVGAAGGTVPSFYSAPVTSGAMYSVTLWGLPPNASLGTKLSCYNGDPLYNSATLTPTSTASYTLGLACLLKANADTAYFTIEGASGVGTAFNLVVQPNPVSFGSLMAPVALTTGPTPTSSSAAYQTTSFYSFSGAPATGKATFSNLSAPVFVYFSNGMGNGFNCDLDPIESSSLTCPYSYSSAGTVTVVVTGATTAGAYFDLKLE